MTDWNGIFDHFGVKRVGKTDKSRRAYVPNKEQLVAIAAAGISPSPGNPFDVTLLFDKQQSVKATFYHSLRQQKGRTPEPRLGTEIITKWLEIGDDVVIGNIGQQLFAAKMEPTTLSDLEVAAAAAHRATPANRQALIDRARKAKGQPAKKEVIRSDFVRDPAVVMGAIARANGRCEMPDCSADLFMRTDGSPYLEVHHIKRLADKGEDTLENAAALCPRCHRELHHGAHRAELGDRLAKAIKA
jgi:hypothetical protein